MTLGQKIENLLKLTAMTKVELTQHLGLKDSSVVSHWVKNRFKPDKSNIKKLAKLFDKPISYFDDDVEPVLEGKMFQTNTRTKTSYTLREGSSNTKTLQEILTQLPKHIGVVFTSKTEYFTMPDNPQADEFLPIMFDSKNNDVFAIKIGSSSVCPWAKKDEYALFLPSNIVQSGKIALFLYDGKYTIKMITKCGCEVLLSDGKTDILVDESEIVIKGQLLSFYRKY